MRSARKFARSLLLIVIIALGSESLAANVPEAVGVLCIGTSASIADFSISAHDGGICLMKRKKGGAVVC